MATAIIIATLASTTGNWEDRPADALCRQLVDETPPSVVPVGPLR